MSRATLFAISLLAHGYIGLRLVPSLASWPWALAAVSTLLVASSVMTPIGLLGRRRRSMRLRAILTWAGMFCLGLFSSLLVLTLVRDAVLLGAHVVDWAWPALGAAAMIAPSSAALVPVAALAITLIGLGNARRTAAIVRIDVPIRDLPPGLHGFTIAQISDVHVGPTIKEPFVHAIVAAVNGLEADMVAVTGDLVDGSVSELAAHVAPLARLSSRHGTFFVTGNHEYYSGAGAWIAELRRLGIRVLVNEHVVLDHNLAQVVVAGVADEGAHHFDPAHRSDARAAIAGAPAKAALRLLLAHQPKSAIAAADAGFHLQLSGHTHGGQFLPWNFFVRFQQPFTAGLHRLRDLWVYTSRGTGYWGPPKRFGAPSEITCLRLVMPTA